MKVFILLLFVLCQPASCRPQPGCTDPRAANFDPAATESDNSCVYDTVFINPEWSLELSGQINETSGLIFWDDLLWTINDDTDTRLYALDPTTGEIVADHFIPGVANRDWEEISQDGDYIYVGDFGNNSGNRTDLHILRISKASLAAGDPSVDNIWFAYSDQQSFEPAGLNQTEFDCEAFVVSKDSIYLFTKQWVSAFTTVYALPKIPGTYTAQRKTSHDMKGLVTGASYLEDEGILVLCGYSALLQPFVHLLSDFQGDDFFSGYGRRLNVSMPFHQVEGIALSNRTSCYISNEGSGPDQIFSIPQKLHFIDLGPYLNK